LAKDSIQVNHFVDRQTNAGPNKQTCARTYWDIHEFSAYITPRIFQTSPCRFPPKQVLIAQKLGRTSYISLKILII